MGIYDRDYYQAEQPGIRLGAPQSMVVKLIIVNVAVFVLCIFVKQLKEYLPLDSGTETNALRWFQFVTYSFTHFEPLHLGGNILCLWMLGRDVETVYGRKEVLGIYLLSAVFGGIVFVARQRILNGGAIVPGAGVIGASGAVTAIVILFCLKFPTRTVLLMFLFPVPAWLIGVVIVLGDLQQNSLGDTGIACDVHLAGAAFALAYHYFGWRVGALFSPDLTALKKTFRAKPKLKIHAPSGRGGELDDEVYDDLDRRGDEVLAKVRTAGEEQVTDEDRRILEADSRRRQQKLR
ncbi:MAG: rhomboid family intramembrane serine protease [Pirellulaceae bacterium]|nr:rhomboid family intramembrane serine protease [Pirellulaceae bacterium]